MKTSFTPEQAATKFCPFVGGGCKAGDCHMWLWDAVRNALVMPWPADIEKPDASLLYNDLLLTPDERSLRYVEQAMQALTPVIGRSVERGVIVAARPINAHLREIGVTIELRETGDCCMRRAGSGS